MLTTEQTNTVNNLVGDYYENHTDPDLPVLTVLSVEGNNVLAVLNLTSINETAFIDADGTFIYADNNKE